MVTQQYGKKQKCRDEVKNFIDLFDFIETESWSREMALRMIIDLLTLCQLKDCVDMLGQYDVPLPSLLDPKNLKPEARYARLLTCVYCNLSSDKEREKFSVKLCRLNKRDNPGPEEEFLDYAVEKCSTGDSANSLLKKAAESFKFESKSFKIVKKAFLDEGIDKIGEYSLCGGGGGGGRGWVFVLSVLLLFRNR